MPDIKKIKEYGIFCAPLFVAFSQFIADTAKNLEVSNIFFFTREGIFFKAAFEAYHSGLKNSTFKCQLLHVSRLSTFAASVKQPYNLSLKRLWSQYPLQTCEEFLLSIGADPIQFFKSTELPADSINRPISELDLNNINIARELDLIFSNKLNQISGYIRSHDFSDENKVLIVDIGWRGTIQDNLAHIFHDKEIHGCYFGLLNRLNKQPPNAHKYAFIADLEINNELAELLRHALPFEMITNSLGGSITGYHNGIPQGNSDPEEDLVFIKYISYLQEAILEECLYIGSHSQTSLNENTTLKSNAIEIWNSILVSPPNFLVEALIELKHNEKFGLGRSLKPGTEVSWLELFFCLFNKQSRDKLRRVYSTLPWKKQLLVHPRTPLPLRTTVLIGNIVQAMNNRRQK